MDEPQLPTAWRLAERSGPYERSQVPFTTEQRHKEVIIRAAAQQGISLAEYIRRLVVPQAYADVGLEMPTDEPPRGREREAVEDDDAKDEKTALAKRIAKMDRKELQALMLALMSGAERRGSRR